MGNVRKLRDPMESHLGWDLKTGGSIIQQDSNMHVVSWRNHCYNMYEAQKVSLGYPGRCFSIDLRYFTFACIGHLFEKRVK